MTLRGFMSWLFPQRPRAEKEKLDALVAESVTEGERVKKVASRASAAAAVYQKKATETLSGIEARIAQQEERRRIKSPQIAAAMEALDLLRRQH